MFKEDGADKIFPSFTQSVFFESGRDSSGRLIFRRSKRAPKELIKSKIREICSAGQARAGTRAKGRRFSPLLEHRVKILI